MAEKHLTDGTTALAAQPRVIKIETAEKPRNAQPRVAAYTRVSSDSDDQLNSFAAQNRYYAELISGKAEWRMVDIYADEGITGTSTAKREDFQRMMADCRRGLIDQILVKSISRFARNTKDCLEAVRELKELGVNVRFEREGIDTANVSSELITAIYAAFAQKESESISGNMRWSYQRRMESGEFNTCRAPWGFRLDGKSLAVHEEEAEIVRRIFLEYLSGRNPREIAEILNAEDTSGRIWKYKAVDYILQNERYVCASMQIGLHQVTFECIDADVLARFLDWLEKERGCSPSTQNQRLACIRSFYKYAGTKDIMLIAYPRLIRANTVFRG